MIVQKSDIGVDFSSKRSEHCFLPICFCFNRWDWDFRTSTFLQFDKHSQRATCWGQRGVKYRDDEMLQRKFETNEFRCNTLFKQNWKLLPVILSIRTCTRKRSSIARCFWNSKWLFLKLSFSLVYHLVCQWLRCRWRSRDAVRDIKRFSEENAFNCCTLTIKHDVAPKSWWCGNWTSQWAQSQPWTQLMCTLALKCALVNKPRCLVQGKITMTHAQNFGPAGFSRRTSETHGSLDPILYLGERAAKIFSNWHLQLAGCSNPDLWMPMMQQFGFSDVEREMMRRLKL